MAPGKKSAGSKNKPPRPPSARPDLAAVPCLAPEKKTLGDKNTASRPSSVLPDHAASLEMPEDEDMDLCSVRARNIMRNNQFANQLGVCRLAELLKNSTKKRVAGKSIANKSKALLLGEDVGNSMSPSGDCVKAVAGRSSKRVLAPEIPEQTMRCTRQRAARQVSAASEPDLSTHQNQDDTNNSEQANLTASTEVQAANELNNTEQGTHTGTIQVRPRGKTMGKEIDSISRGLGGMIPIIIKEGKRRPEPPMQAAKLASESGNIIREHIPIYTDWTKYKNDGSQLNDLKKRLKSKLAIDTDSNPGKAACEDILKCGVRQMRHRLKKKYFDGVPANQVRTTSPLDHMTDDEWKELVELWSSPKHKDKCAKNQLNREKVKYQQRTGSRSYIAHAYVVKEKYKDSEPTAIDLFEEFHCSKTKGVTEQVKKAIDDMHAYEALTSPSVEDGQQAKTSIEAVSKVLPKSNTFLRNVGIQQPAPKTPNVMKELQAELDAKKVESARLQEEIERLKAQAQESDAKVDKQAEEIVSLRKMATDTQNLLRQMFAFGQGQISPP